MPNRSCHKHPKPAAAPPNLTAGAVESPTSRGHLDRGKRCAHAAQAPSPTLHPNLLWVSPRESLPLSAEALDA